MNLYGLDQVKAAHVVQMMTGRSIEEIGKMFADYERCQKDLSAMTKLCDENNKEKNELLLQIVPKLKDQLGLLEREIRTFKKVD